MVVAAISLVGCTSGSDDVELQVFVASSLAEVAQSWETDFEAAHGDVDVVVNAAGSPTLRDQILQGAPAGVVVLADPAMMAPLLADGLIQEPVIVAHNRLAIGVPAGNPGQVTGLDDFDRDELLIGLCGPEVPCGSLAREALFAAGVKPSIDTAEAGVRALAVKLAAGELDAGIVYVSDVANDPAIDEIGIPDEFDQQADYPAAAVVGADPVAAEFVAFLRADRAQQALRAAGFESP